MVQGFRGISPFGFVTLYLIGEAQVGMIVIRMSTVLSRGHSR